MQRQPGYYWVKVKEDKATEGDLDCLMGLLSPLGRWIIVEYNDSDGWGWQYMSYTIFEDHFAEINETRILSPDEVKAISTDRVFCGRFLNGNEWINIYLPPCQAKLLEGLSNEVVNEMIRKRPDLFGLE